MSSTVTFTFKWPSAEPTEVYVTGSFDNWSKSIQLEKTADGFQKTVDLAVSPKNIHYKFVVDGDWKIDQMAAIEKDEHGNDNNVLTTDTLSSLMLTSAAPQSTTAQLAAAVPLEPTGSTEDKAEKPEEGEKTLSVDPIPASVGNEPPVSTASVDKNVTLDKAGYDAPDNLAAQELEREQATKSEAEKPAEQEQAFSVAPIPASIGNEPPVSTAQVDSNVTLDKAGYDAPDTHAAEELKQLAAQSDAAKPAEEEKSFSVAPIPASIGNEPPVSTAQVDSNVTLDKEAYEAGDNHATRELEHLQAQEKTAAETPDQTVEPTFAVDPIPSSTKNEPSEVVNQSIDKDVTLDKESYENATDTTARQMLADLSVQDKAEATPDAPAEQKTTSTEEPSADAAKTGDFTIQSVAPQSTTAALAAQVPFEPTCQSGAAATTAAEAAAKPAEETTKTTEEVTKSTEKPKKEAVEGQDSLKPADQTEDARKKSGESTSPSDKTEKKKKRRSILNFLQDLIK